MPLERGFFVYCRDLLHENEYKVGTAMVTDVYRGSKKNQISVKLYMMIPVEPEQAKQIERAFLVVKSTERIVEIGIDRISQDKIQLDK